ncbi:MAG: ornithine cyclodeaminase family protein [Thermodesulfobacteriota bacterium]
MKIRVLSGKEIRESLPMKEAIEAMGKAFGQLSKKQAAVPLRGRLETDAGVTLLMPAYLKKSREFGVKVVSVYENNSSLGFPVVSAVVLVLDPDTGFPKALMDGSTLTAIRTGAGGGLAAKLLSRKESRVVAIFGAGVQARAQLEGVRAVRSISEVRIISRTRKSAVRLAEEIKSWLNPPIVILPERAKDAVSGADIVVTATTSPEPLFDGNDLSPGSHVTGVGSFMPTMREVDETTVRRSYVVADSREACLAEAGDIIIPHAHIHAEIGEIVNGDKPGRISPDQITFFKSVGVAVQDASAASAALSNAEQKGIGSLLDL